ncbi:hypothetical protein VTN02DRAFT_1809 [Thermoascus thermophilus]
MRVTASAALAYIFAIQQAAAAFWGTDLFFPSPDNCDNECSDQQKSGFDWSDLSLGSFSSYGDLDFSGFSCNDEFSGGSPDNKFGGKCIEGKISKSASGSGPKISCGSDKKGFSISSMRVSSSKKTDVNFYYGMPDGSICKQTASCSPEGTEVTNDQCGGAISVSFHLPDSGDDDDCDFGIHDIGFDCSPPKSPPKHTKSTPSFPETTSAIPSIPETSEIPGASDVPPSSPATTSFPLVPSSPSSPAVSSAASVTSPVQLTTSTVFTTSLITVTSCAPEVTSCPAHSTVVVTSTIAISTTICPVTETTVPSPPDESSPAVSSPAPVSTPASPGSSGVGAVTSPAPISPTGYGASPVSTPAVTSPFSEDTTTTVVTVETVTTCPVTATITSGSREITSVYSTVSTVTLTATSTLCPECEATSTPAPTGKSPAGSSPGSGSGSVPGTSCPTVVPKCINTWLNLTPKCDSNSDISCFCPYSDFTDKVIECVQSWGASEDEVQAALSYFTGICAAYVPQNPGIVTAIPTTVTLVPVPAGTDSTNPPAAAPVTAAPAPVPRTTITYSSIKVTVPMVGFTTVTEGSTAGSVNLIPVTSQVAVPTGKYPITGPSTMATVPVGPGTGALPWPTTSVVPFTGAASSLSVVSSIAAAAAAAALVVSLFY